MSGGTTPHVLIVGGGYVGLYTALRLERRLEAHEARLTMVNPENFMLYQSLLPEVTSGTLEPSHAVVPLRRALKRTRLLGGRVTALDHRRRTATVQPYEGEPGEVSYDHIVLGLGGITKVLPVPGLVERAVGFTTVTEAIFLRNQVLSRMEAAEALTDEAARRRALTFVFVGGGYSGVEALAELEDLAHDACRYFPSISPRDLRWVLVEVTDRILPIVDEDLAEYATRLLRERGVDVYLETSLESAEDGVIVLSNGERFEADTLCWAAGVSPDPLAAELGLPADDMGRLVVDEFLRVRDTPGAWAAGDCAAVPDLVDGGTCPPSAQYAVREARRLGDNLAAVLRGREPTPFRHKSLGELITLGRHQGVARVLRLRLRGFLPWYLRRLYHVARIPSPLRKLDVWLDWTGALVKPRDVVHLGSEEHPREPFHEAAERTRAG